MTTVIVNEEPENTVHVTEEVVRVVRAITPGPTGASGVIEWDTLFTYSADAVVFYDGELYYALRTTVGDQPDLSLSDWGLLTGGGGSASYSQFVYNSSGAQSGNRFNTWSDLMATISAGIDGPIVVNFEQNETLPTGTYNLDNITFCGDGRPATLGGLIITLPNNFNVSSWINGGLDGALGVEYTGTDPLVSLTSGLNLFNLGLGNVLSSTTASFFSVSGGATLITRLNAGATLVNNGYEPISFAGPSNYIAILGGTGSGFNDNIFRGDISAFGMALVIYDSGSKISLTRADANLVGSFSYLPSSNAGLISFNNSTNGFTSTNVQEAIEEAYNNAAPSTIEPRDKLNGLYGLEDRAKYALLGSGIWTSYDSQGFTIPNPGDFNDGGVDIYNEYVPLWQGADQTGMNRWTFQEIFTIEDDLAWGGDLVETAICWKGRNPVPFLEVTAADSAVEDGSGNGYGEYPSIIYTTDQFNGEAFMLQRVRYTYNPSTGAAVLYRPAITGETVASTAFGVDWIVADTRVHQNPGSHPMASVDPLKPIHVGKGSGRYLVSRVTVNSFDGTPYCDFNPSANTIDENTVSDPVIGGNWTNAASPFAKIVDSTDLIENWFTPTQDIINQAQADALALAVAL